MQRGRDRVGSEEDLQPHLSERGVQRRRFRVRWPAALLGAVLASGLLWLERAELAYLLSPREPIHLGGEGRYSFERLASNRFAEIQGIPAANAAYARHGDTVYVVLGLQNSPVLVRREALPTEDWVPNRPPPRPDPRPFDARGRLLERADASEYEPAFQMLARDVVPRQGRLWILLEGERPGGETGTLVVWGVVAAFGLVNLWLVVLDLAGRRFLGVRP
jgi:hypothetical protein